MAKEKIRTLVVDKTLGISFEADQITEKDGTKYYSVDGRGSGKVTIPDSINLQPIEIKESISSYLENGNNKQFLSYVASSAFGYDVDIEKVYTNEAVKGDETTIAKWNKIQGSLNEINDEIKVSYAGRTNSPEAVRVREEALNSVISKYNMGYDVATYIEMNKNGKSFEDAKLDVEKNIKDSKALRLEIQCDNLEKRIKTYESATKNRSKNATRDAFIGGVLTSIGLRTVVSSFLVGGGLAVPLIAVGFGLLGIIKGFYKKFDKLEYKNHANELKAELKSLNKELDKAIKLEKAELKDEQNLEISKEEQPEDKEKILLVDEEEPKDDKEKEETEKQEKEDSNPEKSEEDEELKEEDFDFSDEEKEEKENSDEDDNESESDEEENSEKDKEENEDDANEKDDEDTENEEDADSNDEEKSEKDDSNEDNDKKDSDSLKEKEDALNKREEALNKREEELENREKAISDKEKELGIEVKPDNSEKSMQQDVKDKKAVQKIELMNYKLEKATNGKAELEPDSVKPNGFEINVKNSILDEEPKVIEFSSKNDNSKIDTISTNDVSFSFNKNIMLNSNDLFNPTLSVEDNLGKMIMDKNTDTKPLELEKISYHNDEGIEINVKPEELSELSKEDYSKVKDALTDAIGEKTANEILDNYEKPEDKTENDIDNMEEFADNDGDGLMDSADSNFGNDNLDNNENVPEDLFSLDEGDIE